MYLLLVGAAATAYYFTGLRHLVLGQHFDITGGQKTRSNFQGGSILREKFGYTLGRARQVNEFY